MNQQRKAEWKDILDGIGLFLRDADLPKHCGEKYLVGAIGSPSNRIGKKTAAPCASACRVGRGNV